MNDNHPAKRDRAAAIATLLVLSPLIAEVLFGATHITMLYLLVPQICIYGGAALIIRTLAGRRRWNAILLLGIAFAISLECVILQTSVSPPYQRLLFGSAPNQNYLGPLQTNWYYLMWALVYESVWSIILPIQLVELIFPTQRTEAWIGLRGLTITTIVFLVASFGIWYTFTQTGIAPGLAYEVPLLQVLAALVIIAALGAAALRLPPFVQSEKRSAHSVPQPWLVGLAAFFMALPWFGLAIEPYVVSPSVPTLIPIAVGLIWAAASYLLVKHWSVGYGWQDIHKLALIFGALGASMLAGFLINGPAMSPVDLIGKAALNIIAVVLLIFLALRLHRVNRPAEHDYPGGRGAIQA